MDNDNLQDLAEKIRLARLGLLEKLALAYGWTGQGVKDRGPFTAFYGKLAYVLMNALGDFGADPKLLVVMSLCKPMGELLPSVTSLATDGVKEDSWKELARYILANVGNPERYAEM